MDNHKLGHLEVRPGPPRKQERHPIIGVNISWVRLTQD